MGLACCWLEPGSNDPEQSWPGAKSRSAAVSCRSLRVCFSPASIADAGARQCQRAATTESQASGGARDRNGARRGAIKTTAAELKCSTDRATNGTGSCGAGGRNEIAVRWIVAQIAQ